MRTKWEENWEKEEHQATAKEWIQSLLSSIEKRKEERKHHNTIEKIEEKPKGRGEHETEGTKSEPNVQVSERARYLKQN